MVDAGWADVLRRATRLRRRRRFVVAAAATAVALVGALAASGQIGSLLGHSKEPHLVLRAQVGGASVQVDLQHAVVVIAARGFELEPFSTPTAGRRPDYPARWFFSGPAGGTLSAVGGGRKIVLCSPCRARDAGRVALPRAVAAALVARRGVVAYGSSRSRMTLDAAHLHRGVRCYRGNGALRCTPIFGGR